MTEETSQDKKQVAGHKRKNEIKELIKPLGETLKNGIPEMKWLVHNLVLERGITIFAGPPACMKSYLAQQMALNVASNTTYLDQFKTEKGNILYFDEENGEQALIRRFAQLRNEDEETEEDLNNINLIVFSGLKLDEEDYIYALELLINEYKPNLIIFDSMVRLMTGEEDKSGAVKQVFEGLKALMENYNISIVILHHTRKNGTGSDLRSLRGSSDFGAFADVVLMIEKTGHQVKITMEKNRHIDTSEIKPFSINVYNENENIRFAWNGLSETQTKEDLLEKEIKDWINLQNHNQPFCLKGLIDIMKSKGFSRTAFYNVIGKFKTNGKLIQDQKKGFYRFVPEQTTIPEEYL